MHYVRTKLNARKFLLLLTQNTEFKGGWSEETDQNVTFKSDAQS